MVAAFGVLASVDWQLAIDIGSGNGLVAVPLALYFGQDGMARALLIGSLLLVLIVEILNSGLEAIVDKASPEKHELAKRAKDMGSAAVLLALINAAVVWACVLWPGTAS